MCRERVFILFVSLFIGLLSTAQNNRYWIRFTDKSNNAYSLQNPDQFLSALSIERRAIQNISINETDLPVTETYINQVSPFITKLYHRLKWSNLLVVEITNPSLIDSVLKFPFVDTVGRIEFNPERSVQTQDKFEAIIPVNQQLIYPNQYGIAYRQANMLNVDLLHQMGYRGKDVLVSVMDNGFLNTHLISAFDSVRDRIVGTYDFVNLDDNVYDAGGHGTSTFSDMAANVPNLFLGTAPDADYLLLETEDNSMEWVMEEYNWAAAAEYADSIGAKIFSTSLGYTTFDSSSSNHIYADLTGSKTVITRAANTAFSKGILVINSAGNEGNKSWYHISAPADGDSVLAIGAVDSAGEVTNFSGRGPNSLGRIKPDICAQGSKSAVITTGGDIGYSAGTSFSCPILAGAAACLWGAFPEKSAREIYDAIIISSDHFWTPDNFHGYGIPNFYNAYWLLKTNYDGTLLRIDDDVLVYPNPFFNELNIALYNKEDKSRTVEIFDLQGRKVYSTQTYIRKGTFEMKTIPDLQSLLAGEYILRVDGDKENVHRILKLR